MKLLLILLMGWVCVACAQPSKPIHDVTIIDTLQSEPIDSVYVDYEISSDVDINGSGNDSVILLYWVRTDMVGHTDYVYYASTSLQIDGWRLFYSDMYSGQLAQRSMYVWFSKLHILNMSAIEAEYTIKKWSPDYKLQKID
jgi:hypothetical protein